MKGQPDILEKERENRQKIPDLNVSGDGLGFHDIPQTVRRLDIEPVLIDQIDLRGFQSIP